METKEITESKCSFVILTKLPDNKVYQVLLTDEEIRMAIRMSGSFQVIDTPIETVEITNYGE